MPLTPQEILSLDAALMQAFRTIEELRRRIPAAKHIKYPPLPSIFSESLVIAAAQRLFGPGWAARYGGRECDVLIESLNSAAKRVEVKATAGHAFQEFKTKDLQADVLVWIRFGRRFQEGNGAIEILLVSQPGRVIRAPCRLDKIRFERLAKDCAGLTTLSFASLEELLDLAPDKLA